MRNIKFFDDLIKSYISTNKTIVNKKISNFLPPGENYMSDILKIDVTLKNNENGNEEEIHIIAKVAATNEFVGSTSYMTKSELLFYQEIIPAIESFSERHGLPKPSFFPKFMGGRLNLTGGTTADDNAVILIENLLGFENVDRHVGFDLVTTKYILKDLATFHAIPIAMKLLEPELFETKLKANCYGLILPKRIEYDENGAEIEAVGFPENTLEGHIFLIKLLQQDERYIEASKKYEKFYNRIKNIISREATKLFHSEPVDPYATLVHQDMWINNIMLVFQDGRSIENKFIDFQICRITSPITDLLFFLFTSVQTSCLKSHLDALITHYHDHFVEILKTSGCYNSQFSYENFLKEMRASSTQAIIQTVFMLPNVVWQKKGEMYESAKKESLFQDHSPKLAERLTVLGVEAAKRGWI
ncbi:uncharacterized protein LOC130446441 [Diorhabda sublineata]|uniref:uncharacterized protein LOC130446441 n=1 Tax=Diorhabda sublineata TaxID=1163346 RepID=UPI0024E0621E|nr:uncharacterized protein LOC130446441 [Diorhabda sublineata]